MIDTDSPTIRDYVEEQLPEVMVLERPEHLSAGEIPMNTVLANSIAQLDGDVFLQTHSTNPFLTDGNDRCGRVDVSRTGGRLAVHRNSRARSLLVGC